MTDERFEEMLASYLENSLPEIRLVELREELKASPARLSEYLDMEETHAMLKCCTGFSFLAAHPLPRHKIRSRLFPHAAAAAALILLAGTTTFLFRREAPQKQPHESPPSVFPASVVSKASESVQVKQAKIEPSPIWRTPISKPLRIAKRSDSQTAAIAAITSKENTLVSNKDKTATREKKMKKAKLAAVAAAVVCATPPAVKATSASTALVDGKSAATFIDARSLADTAAPERFIDARVFADGSSAGRSTWKIDTAKPLGTVIMLM